MRLFAVLLCLALAGCGANASLNMTQAEIAAPSAAARNAHAAAKRDDAKEEWWKDGGVTREKINAMCWMKFEKGRRDVSIDKRADLVNDCVTQALKEHPLR